MEEPKLTIRKTDRRTLITKGMIKDALLELLQNTPYEKITVTALCKQSEITRATFYLHYNNIDNVLDELLDDALRLTELDAIQPLPSAISNRGIENEKTSKKETRISTPCFLPVSAPPAIPNIESFFWTKAYPIICSGSCIKYKNPSVSRTL